MICWASCTLAVGHSDFKLSLHRLEQGSNLGNAKPQDIWGLTDTKNRKSSGCGEFIPDPKMVKITLNCNYLLRNYLQQNFNKMGIKLITVDLIFLMHYLFGLMIDQFGMMIDQFGMMIDQFGMMIDQFGMMIDRFGLMIDQGA